MDELIWKVYMLFRPTHLVFYINNNKYLANMATKLTERRLALNWQMWDLEHAFMTVMLKEIKISKQNITFFCRPLS